MKHVLFMETANLAQFYCQTKKSLSNYLESSLHFTQTMRRSLILNILCPSGRNIIICVIVLMIFLSTLITFLLFDDITSSSISIIYHIHSDIPHHSITSTLYQNQSKLQLKNARASAKLKQLTQSQQSRVSFLDLIDSYPPFDTNGNTEIFVNGKSFSQIMHDTFRPSLTNLLPQNEDNDDQTQIFNDTTENETIITSNDTDTNHTKNIYQQHLEWYSSKPIPYLLENELTITKEQTVATKLIYHSKLQHFILITIKQCNDKQNSKNSKFCLNIYERDARPFLWKYAFDTKYLYQHHKHSNHLNDKKKCNKKKHKQSEYEDKKAKLVQSLQNFQFLEFFEIACDLVVDDLKSIGLDLSLGYDNLDELSDILQEIILKESTQNPSFDVKSFSCFMFILALNSLYYDTERKCGWRWKED